VGASWYAASTLPARLVCVMASRTWFQSRCLSRSPMTATVSLLPPCGMAAGLVIAGGQPVRARAGGRRVQLPWRASHLRLQAGRCFQRLSSDAPEQDLRVGLVHGGVAGAVEIALLPVS
jgi:hypothetical protein